MQRINMVEEDAEMEFTGEINHYEAEYMEDYEEYIETEGLQDLKEILIRY